MWLSTLQGINISHLGKRKIIFKMPFWGDMLVPWRVIDSKRYLLYKYLKLIPKKFRSYLTNIQLYIESTAAVAETSLWILWCSNLLPKISLHKIWQKATPKLSPTAKEHFVFAHPFPSQNAVDSALKENEGTVFNQLNKSTDVLIAPWHFGVFDPFFWTSSWHQLEVIGWVLLILSFVWKKTQRVDIAHGWATKTDSGKLWSKLFPNPVEDFPIASCTKKKSAMLLWPSRTEEEFPLMVNVHQNTSAAFHLLNIPSREQSYILRGKVFGMMFLGR